MRFIRTSTMMVSFALIVFAPRGFASTSCGQFLVETQTARSDQADALVYSVTFKTYAPVDAALKPLINARRTDPVRWVHQLIDTATVTESQIFAGARVIHDFIDNIWSYHTEDYRARRTGAEMTTQHWSVTTFTRSGHDVRVTIDQSGQKDETPALDKLKVVEALRVFDDYHAGEAGPREFTFEFRIEIRGDRSAVHGVLPIE